MVMAPALHQILVCATVDGLDRFVIILYAMV